jgi:hypothetical protein
MSDNREETVEECPGNVLTDLLTTDLDEPGSAWTGGSATGGASRSDR